MKKFTRAWNKKVDSIDIWLNETFGKKLPKFLEKNMTKIYFLSFVAMILAMIHAYFQRGYLAFGGEVMIMLLPAILDMYLNMRDDD